MLEKNLFTISNSAQYLSKSIISAEHEKQFYMYDLRAWFTLIFGNVFYKNSVKSGPEVLKLFSCSTELSMEF